MGIIDKCGVRGDATFCVVIFSFALVLKMKVTGKQSHCQTPYSRFNSVTSIINFDDFFS